MQPKLKDLFSRAETWPQAMQEAAVASLLAIEEEHAGVYCIDAQEWAAIEEGLAQADRGEFVPPELVSEADKRHGL